ncbi:tachykinin-like peptides receptor 86C [Dinothrombium tinctorium]|uniref:Tachykinin-like peptides receptor 86C n=1 Tax=Dinothrombium tinctorium TaxID=1965070 RepID=A0A3S3PWW4_9ACAR|nr:tachykinin-like peptides receptor 86C [Dinothrombium tinctorium]RWS10432.1 tachykinin-like peptides receptor 86C [Dinothrombium tinctorium]RWS16120.1 tachykinin-like peptides receptor 86C [Dinothrombium tinctorium]
MVFFAFAGNVLVICIILKYKKMRTKINLFLLNLSFADLIMVTFNAMFNFVYMLNSHWPFGDVYCTFSNFIANFSIGLSVFTITATSVDRYIVVVYPLKARTSKKTSAIVILVIWLLSALLAIPTLIFSTTFTFEYSEGEKRTLCTLQWPDGLSGASTYDYIYQVIFFVLTYAIPMTSMTITYTVMARALWSNRMVGELNEGQREAVRSKQKVVLMLITVTVIFGVCWLPYHLYFLYIFHNLELSAEPWVQHFFLGFYWLAMSNSTLNPLIYALLNKRSVNVVCKSQFEFLIF